VKLDYPFAGPSKLKEAAFSVPLASVPRTTI
jgi:hypothetical protein